MVLMNCWTWDSNALHKGSEPLEDVYVTLIISIIKGSVDGACELTTFVTSFNGNLIELLVQKIVLRFKDQNTIWICLLFITEIKCNTLCGLKP